MNVNVMKIRIYKFRRFKKWSFVYKTYTPIQLNERATHLHVEISYLKLPFCTQFINFIKHILRSQHACIITNASYDGICVWFERKKQHNIGSPTFTLPTSSNQSAEKTLMYKGFILEGVEH